MTLALLLACAPAVNHAPVLQTASVADGDTIDIPTVGVDIQVIADDPDGDVMQFRWAIDGIGVHGTDVQNSGSTTSTYNVYGAGNDGATLSLMITDGVDAIDLSWPMVYVGA